MSNIRFRLLLLLHVVLISLEVGAAFLPGSPEECIESCAPHSGWLTGESWAATTVLIAMSVIWLVGFVGLFLFKPWGRTLSLCSTVAWLAAYPFLGPTAISGVSGMLSEASTLVWGAALALAYYSPMSSSFER